jgi:hypothetical protein
MKRSDTQAFGKELDHDKNTGWLRGCEWPLWFANNPIYLNPDLPLGLWN